MDAISAEKKIENKFIVGVEPCLKLWLAEHFHNHDVGVKPQALNLTKLFVKSVQELTKKFDENNTFI